jgi:hypothetical protein
VEGEGSGIEGVGVFKIQGVTASSDNGYGIEANGIRKYSAEASDFSFFVR